MAVRILSQLLEHLSDVEDAQCDHSRYAAMQRCLQFIDNNQLAILRYDDIRECLLSLLQDMAKDKTMRPLQRRFRHLLESCPPYQLRDRQKIKRLPDPDFVFY